MGVSYSLNTVTRDHVWRHDNASFMENGRFHRDETMYIRLSNLKLITENGFPKYVLRFTGFLFRKN